MGEVTKKIAILITGTIVPNSNFVANSNSDIRRKEYLDNLIYYSNEFKNYDIYFLENSNYDFLNDNEYQKLFNNKYIHLIKFPLSDKVNEGKGYQEFNMLDQAIEQLKNKYENFVKITGRYKVLNLNNLIENNSKDFTADSHKKLKVTETNVFIVKTTFYIKYLKNKYTHANDANNVFIEHVVYDTISQNNLWKNVSIFKTNPLIKGTSGSYGGTLNRNKYKMMIRNIERKILLTLNINQFLIEY